MAVVVLVSWCVGDGEAVMTVVVWLWSCWCGDVAVVLGWLWWCDFGGVAVFAVVWL